MPPTTAADEAPTASGETRPLLSPGPGPDDTTPTTFSDAARAHPAAIGWSAFVSLGVVMLAFDPQLLGNLFATPQFRRDFGRRLGDDGSGFTIPAAWQTALSMGNPLGQVVGALFAAHPMDRYGRRATFAACVAATAAVVLVQFLARDLAALLAGELLAGLVLGSFVVIAPAYASEVCPTALRGHLSALINLCFVLGALLANCVTAGTSRLRSHWAYSLPFALQWVWIAVIVPGLPLVPESPWWLVRKGRPAEAEASLRRLAAPGVDVAAALDFIVDTDTLERKNEAGTTYRDCLRGTNLRRTEISVGVYSAQVLSGIYLVGYGTYFFERAGLSTERAFDMAILFLLMGLVGTILSWFLLLRFGRRTIYLSGLAVLAALQLVIGIIDCTPGRPRAAVWAEAWLMLVWNFVYDLTIGPVCFVIISEVSATRLRSKTIALATAVQGFFGIAMTAAIPYLIAPDQADLQGKLGFVFGGLAALSLLWAWARVPETGGRTYEELDVLFERRVPARQFSGYVIE